MQEENEGCQKFKVTEINKMDFDNKSFYYYSLSRIKSSFIWVIVVRFIFGMVFINSNSSFVDFIKEVVYDTLKESNVFPRH